MTFEAKARQVIRELGYSWIEHGNTWKELADMAGISVSTLRRLVEGDTVYPRFCTVEAVLMAFGRYIEMNDQVKTNSPMRGIEKEKENGSRIRPH